MNMHLFRTALEELTKGRSSEGGDQTDQDTTEGDTLKRRHRGEVESFHLTDDERAILANYAANGKATKALLKNSADGINARTGAFRAGERALRAEIEYMRAMLEFEEMHGNLIDVHETAKAAHEQIVGRDKQIRELEAEVARLRELNMNEIAATAAAVHSEGTR